ncbi:HPr(Ser) kinase/phosphatase [bacterium]|nr:HPr(Ser) kinase/phosphatase [bacterium]
MELTVQELFEEKKADFQLDLANKKGNLNNIITEPDLHRPGLALSGFTAVFTHQRIQIIGNSEIEYMRTQSKALRRSSVTAVLEFSIPCIIISNDNTPPPMLCEVADEKQIPVFTTPMTTTKLFQVLGDYLELRFAPRTVMHGSLVSVHGIGLLFTGRSGIGKSEIALDLVERGHQLVADDVVNVVQRNNIIIGSPSEIARDHLEVRGLGIINVRNIFGIKSLRQQKRIQARVNLRDWNEKFNVDRIGIDEATTQILGVELPLIELPINPGKNITVLAEVIALNTHLKLQGRDAAHEFQNKLLEQMKRKTDEKGTVEQTIERTHFRRKLFNHDLE